MKKEAGRLSVRIAMPVTVLVGIIAAVGNVSAQAADGDGQLKIGGALRARYDYTFDYAQNVSKLNFDTFRIDVNYDSSTFFGSAQYRFYGGAYPYDYTSQVGRINFPAFAWLGYKTSDSTRVVVGLNQMPFGLLPYASNTFYQTLINNVGLEDVHNLGAKVLYKSGSVDLQFGFSKNGARYSVNVVDADSGVAGGSRNRERNIMVGRLAYALQHSANASSELGISALHSTLHNADTDDNGHRNAYALHYGGKFGPLGVLAEAGRQSMSPRNPAADNGSVTFGAFDGTFNVASKGDFYSAEVSYALPWVAGPVNQITPYLNYSAFIKDKSGFKNSERFIAGAHFNAGPLFVYTEMRWGKNDPYTGDYVNGAAAGGDDVWKKVFFANIGYYF